MQQQLSNDRWTVSYLQQAVGGALTSCPCLCVCTPLALVTYHVLASHTIAVSPSPTLTTLLRRRGCGAPPCRSSRHCSQHMHARSSTSPSQSSTSGAGCCQLCPGHHASLGCPKEAVVERAADVGSRLACCDVLTCQLNSRHAPRIQQRFVISGDVLKVSCCVLWCMYIYMRAVCREDTVPQLQDISNTLKAETGWQVGVSAAGHAHDINTCMCVSVESTYAPLSAPPGSTASGGGCLLHILHQPRAACAPVVFAAGSP